MNTPGYLPPDPHHEHDRLRRSDHLTRAAMYAGIALLCGIIMGAIAMRTFNSAGGTSSDGLRPPPTITLATGPTVLNAIKKQAKLETISMRLTLDKTVARVSGIANVCSEKMTYLGYFNATAGIDLSRIETQNVAVINDGFPDKAEVIVTLPPAEIMHVELDTKKSRIVAQETPQWIPGCARQIADMTVEAQEDLRTKAEAAAKEEGILAKAQEQAGFEVRLLLLNAGYKNVTVRYAPGQEPEADAPATPLTQAPQQNADTSSRSSGVLSPPDPDVPMTPVPAAKRKPIVEAAPRPKVAVSSAPPPKGILSVAPPITKVKEKPTVKVVAKPMPKKSVQTFKNTGTATRKPKSVKKKSSRENRSDETLSKYVN